ncbi:hypothetical protein PAXRUDRAFT_180357, partial [Paxillus rubicundulus Ve08.2h10]
PPSPGHSLVRGSHHPVLKVAGPRTSWRFWYPSRGGQPEMTTVYAAEALYPHAAASDPSQPAQVPPQWETIPGDYLTHSVLLDIPSCTPTDDNHDDAPNKNLDDRGRGAFCGPCSMFFHRRSTPRPNLRDPGVHDSGVEIGELRLRREDEQTLTAVMSTHPATSIAKAEQGTQCGHNEHRSAHNTAIEVERLRTEAAGLRLEAERLRIEEAAASRAHELLILNRQIELARIHAGYPALVPIDSRRR